MTNHLASIATMTIECGIIGYLTNGTLHTGATFYHFEGSQRDFIGAWHDAAADHGLFTFEGEEMTYDGIRTTIEAFRSPTTDDEDLVSKIVLANPFN